MTVLLEEGELEELLLVLWVIGVLFFRLFAITVHRGQR
jgi:hypothetical protein